MKIKVELYGSSRDLSKNNFIELDLKDNCLIKDLRNELYKFVKNNHSGNKNFHEIIKTSAFCSEKNEIIYDDYKISKDQKISIIPPIGGG